MFVLYWLAGIAIVAATLKFNQTVLVMMAMLAMCIVPEEFDVQLAKPNKHVDKA